MKKVLLVTVIAVGLFSMKNIYGNEEKIRMKEFKHALETKNIDALNKMLEL